MPHGTVRKGFGQRFQIFLIILTFSYELGRIELHGKVFLMTVPSRNKRKTKAVDAIEKLVDAQHVPDLTRGLVDLRNALLKSVIFGSNKSHAAVGDLISDILQREIWAVFIETVDYSQIVSILELFTDPKAPEAFNRKMPAFLGNIITELGELGYAACTIITHLESFEDDIKCPLREETSTLHLLSTPTTDDADRITRNHIFLMDDLPAQMCSFLADGQALRLGATNSGFH